MRRYHIYAQTHILNDRGMCTRSETWHVRRASVAAELFADLSAQHESVELHDAVDDTIQYGGLS